MSKPRTGAPKRVAVGLLAGALALAGVALAPPAGAAANVDSTRVAGATRYGTAAAVAGHAAFNNARSAIIATGENFPDALAASSLAGANAPAPILLTQTNTLTQEASAGLDALEGKGVTAVFIVGGTAAVSEAVEDAIKDKGFTVTRVAGDDRYETAAAISEAAHTTSPAAPIGGLRAALIATGTNFPDALAGGPLAYANRLPLLLVNETVPAATANAISTIGVRKVYILGGTAAVSAAVEAQLVQLTGNPATRLAGINRYATAAAVGDFAINTLGFIAADALLATGENFPDALAAGPLGGQVRGPIVLVQKAALPDESEDFLDRRSPTIQRLWVIGGTEVIEDAVVAAAEAAAENVGNDAAGTAVTTRPELTGAAIVSTVTPGQATPAQPAGTYVRYTFDEATGAGFAINAGLFHVYDANRTINANGTSATREAAGNTVLVYFNGITTAAQASTLVKATVDFGAVRDASGQENPEGDAPIGSASQTVNTAGVTTAPDLTSVAFRQSAVATQTAVDFVFDQAATVTNGAGFNLVDVNNNTVPCTGSTTPASAQPGGQNVAGGSGSTTITVLCTNSNQVPVTNPNGDLWSTSNVARAFVAPDAVRSVATTPVPNVLQAVDVTGNSLGPDLVSVAIGNANIGGGLGTLIFTFDQAISTATPAANFQAYFANATSAPGQAAAVNAANPTQVAVTFTSAQVTNAVGGNVADSTVTNTDQVTPRSNRPDEEGKTGSTVTVTPGRINGPDLMSVALSTPANQFGANAGFQASYTFDSSAAAPLAYNGNPNLFYLYAADGRRFQATACAVSTTAAATTVDCTGWRDATTLAAFGTPTVTQANLLASVLGTVDDGAVTASGIQNTEDAERTTGGTGTPAS